jgi:mannose-6-phosphate isomerase-like protein (cupin superfamily)
VPDRKESEIKHTPSMIKVEKPWGRFEQYTHNLQSMVKIITVAPGGILSRQYHHHCETIHLGHKS